jgi:hypothetical protein
MGIFMLLIPSMVVGTRFNGECLGMWWQRMITPYVVEGATSPQDVNQSAVGVLSRMLTELTPGHGPYQPHHDLNLASWPPWVVRYLIRAVVAGLLGLLALLCTTKTRDRRDPRLLGEFALVVLTMLFASERSWKHHYVTVLLPITYLAYEYFSMRVGRRGRRVILAAWALSFGLMASTSTEIGGWVADGQGHEIAQGYGLFMWAGVVLYATVAWRVWLRRQESPLDPKSAVTSPSIPRSHMAAVARSHPFSINMPSSH